MKITGISINGFRGAAKQINLDFDDKPIALIFGENGNGKSTITDAFDVICNKDVGGLKDVSVPKEKKSYLKSIEATQFVIELNTTAGKWKAEMNPDIVVTPENGCPKAFILRRNKLSEFVNAIPSKRFESIRAFVDVSTVEEKEKTLNAAISEVKRRYHDATQEYVRSQTMLQNMHENEGYPELNYLEWATSEIKTDVTELSKEVKELNDLDGKINLYKKMFLDTCKEYGKLAMQKKVLDHAQSELTLLAEDQERGNIELLELLKTTKNYFEKKPFSNICPVCEQSVEFDLASKISERVNSLQKLNKALEGFNLAQKKHDKQKEITSSKIVAMKDTAVITAARINDSWVLGLEQNATASALPIHALEDNSIAYTLRMMAKQNINMLEKQALISKTLYKKDKTVKLYTTIKMHLDLYNEKVTNAKSFEKLLNTMTKALELLQKQRQGYISDVLNKVSQSASRLYQIVHPGENIGNVSLTLGEKERASLKLLGDFYNHNQIPPQAYYSEAHIDTLGICMFLALSKLYREENSILILDDVLSSIDSQHIERFINLFASETTEFGKIIITTHYRSWKERYRTHQHEGSHIQFIELKGWNLQEGVYIDSELPAISEIEGLMPRERFNRQEIASKSGILLEAIFDSLSLQYRLKMPRKTASDYTLGEYLNALDSKLLDLLEVKRFNEQKVEIENIRIKPLITELKSLAWIRNQVGAHFSLAGIDVSDNDVLIFAQATVRFVKAIICPITGGIPRKNAGTCWESTKGRTQLYPLSTPGAIF